MSLNQQLYSVYDSKVQSFSPPFIQRNNADATRNFAQAAAEPNSQLAQFPSDFSLYFIGTFDSETGILHKGVHVNLGTAASYLHKPIPNDVPTAVTASKRKSLKK